jgi:hypothetical protein
LTGKNTPRSSVLVSSTTNCSASPADVRAALSKIRIKLQRALSQKVQKDIDAGILPGDANAVTLESLIMAVIQGMSMHARDGADQRALIRVADAAMDAWPIERWKRSE